MPNDKSVKKRECWVTRLKNRITRSKPLGSGEPNRHGLPKLPVGQRVSSDWPVLDLGHHPEISQDEWRLDIDGLVCQPMSLSWEDFMALDQVEEVSDFHCVTSWSHMDNRWQGVRFRSLAELVCPKAKAAFVFVEGYDRQPGSEIPYTTCLPLESALEEDVLLVHSWNDAPLTREHGGPCRMVTPRLYAWKGAKWIRRISFLSEDKPGFWEERGYSKAADPWLNDRFRLHIM